MRAFLAGAVHLCCRYGRVAAVCYLCCRDAVEGKSGLADGPDAGGKSPLSVALEWYWSHPRRRARHPHHPNNT